MRKPLIYLAIAALLAGCRGGSTTLQKKDQQSYDVVQEGQASGVTSTINAPGETVPPMTATNADTTSNFALPGVTTTSSTAPPGSIAGTLPQDTSGSMVMGYPTDTAQRPRPVVRPRPPQQQPPRTDTTGTTLEGPPPSTSTIPPNTDTAPPPPPTDTTSTVSGEKKKDEKPSPQPPTQTDTQPPPTNTSTGV